MTDTAPLAGGTAATGTLPEPLFLRACRRAPVERQPDVEAAGDARTVRRLPVFGRDEFAG